MPTYSVVVPVYNSEKSLEILYARVRDVFDNIICRPFELILVDDCSKDSSFMIICELTKKDSRVKGIQLALNHGQQKAVLCGMNYASGDFIVTMDDDLQHPPEEIPKLIAKMESSNNYDVVIGEYDRKKHGPIRKFGSALMNLSNNIIYKKPKELKMTSFRLIRRKVVDNLLRINVNKPMVGMLLLQTTSRIVNTEVQHDPRQFGRSGYSFGKLVNAFFTNLMTNSDLPLVAISWIGIFSMFASVILIFKYIILYFIRGTSIQGWTSSVVLLLFFGGMILFAMGIIGRYLTNIMQEAKKYPSFMIRQEISKDKKD